ncbi:hypothetical protein [Pseudoxanthomonas mexicana]|uniref:hypothetical protein n=1 Tax=Pseudoxanthomonas mexicana TaxID=128785 RepID=UPI000AF27481|nr:hypothetical protein [Pseudoxanthomonas mexicana]
MASPPASVLDMLAPVDPDDAAWLPFDVDLAGGRMQWLRCDEALIQASVFLDPRMPAEGRPQALTPLAPLACLPPSGHRPAWLWHTSFCGSTLLARLLHLPPYSVALREPLVLRRLSDFADGGQEVSRWLPPVIRLLSRPWRPDGRVVLKPTHAALNIARQAMDAVPDANAVLLTSRLEDFLVSHLKKTEETLSKVPLLVQRALRAGTLAARLPPEALQPPSILAAAALQWAAQRELVADLRTTCGDRLQVLEWSCLSAEIEDGTVSTAAFLGLTLPEDALRMHVRVLAGSHSKATSRPYDARMRDQEHALLRSTYRNEVTQALRWAAQYVLPALQAGALLADE